MTGFVHWFACAYRWVKDNDVPNTFTLFVTLVFWPLLVIWWQTRTVAKISNLIISFNPRPSPIAMNGGHYPAVNILFENQTPSIVYVTGPRLRNWSKLFPVPMIAIRDVGENVHPLSFFNAASGLYQDHQVTLATNGKAESTIAVTSTMQASFYAYNTPWPRRVFRRRKYFVIEYTAMVGERKYRVSDYPLTSP